MHDLREDQLAEFVDGFHQFFAASKAVWELPYDSRHTREAIVECDAQTVADG